jgi:hypothetical protein
MRMTFVCSLALLIVLAGRDVAAGAPATAPPPAAATPSWDVAQVKNLEWLPKLTARQRELLGRQGFFLAPQVAARAPAAASSGAARAGFRATQLFEVYTANATRHFPSYVTADLAIDTTHAYFGAVLSHLEEYQLGPMLRAGVSDLLRVADLLRSAARTERGHATALRIERYWGIALRLLDANAALPEAVKADVEKDVSAIRAGAETLPAAVTTMVPDLTQLKPRGHYTKNPVLGRYFEAMSWLGMAAFPIDGEAEDVAGLALLARSWLAAPDGRQTLTRVLGLTTFFVGGSDTAGMEDAAEVLRRVAPDAGRRGADALVDERLLTRLRRALAAGISRPRVATLSGAREIRVLGRRAFDDTVAMKALIPALQSVATVENETLLIPAAMGALGAGAVAGSREARDEILRTVPASARDAFERALAEGENAIAKQPVGRWSADAYAATLNALRELVAPVDTAIARGAPITATGPWRIRWLQTFAGGWAELRHDTILYGEEPVEGGGCSLPESPPPAWVDPLPGLYRRLGDVVRSLQKRLGDAGIKMDQRIRRPGEGVPFTDSWVQPNTTTSLSDKASILLSFLDFLAMTADLEIQGRAFSGDTLGRLASIGGEVYRIFETLSDSATLSKRDNDMAVIADVFTWRPIDDRPRVALEVGVAHPDLVFAVIPSPSGPVLARGAVMSYREFLQPATARLTNESWREQVRAGREPPLPAWTKTLYAEPVGALTPPKKLGIRCGQRRNGL